MENDHFRTVLINHCINVPPPQPLTGKRRPAKSASLSSIPPSFVPPGRPRLRASEKTQKPLSPTHSISSKSSQSSLQSVGEQCRLSPLKNSNSESSHSAKDPEAPPSNHPTSLASSNGKSQELIDGSSSLTEKRASSRSQGDSTGRDAQSSCSDTIDSDEDSSVVGDDSMEHIIIGGHLELPTSMSTEDFLTQVSITVDFCQTVIMRDHNVRDICHLFYSVCVFWCPNCHHSNQSF